MFIAPYLKKPENITIFVVAFVLSDIYYLLKTSCIPLSSRSPLFDRQKKSVIFIIIWIFKILLFIFKSYTIPYIQINVRYLKILTLSLS